MGVKCKGRIKSDFIQVAELIPALLLVPKFHTGTGFISWIEGECGGW